MQVPVQEYLYEGGPLELRRGGEQVHEPLHRDRLPDQSQETFPTRLLIKSGGYKECRLSLLTNSTLLIGVQMRGRGGSCGVSANEYSWAHHVTWNPNKDLPPYLTYEFNPWIFLKIP
jgi:hypothetical protein